MSACLRHDMKFVAVTVDHSILHDAFAEVSVDFEESSYVFPEGVTSDVCLTITNSVTLAQTMTFSIFIGG